MPHRPRTLLTSLLLVLALAAAACGGGGSESDTGGTGDAAAGGSDTINISGSSTVEPISALVADRFNQQVSPDVNITVEGPGTGDGFVAFCAGQTDVSDASRPIAEQEQQTCRDNGVEYVELKVAIDGISVLTSPDNDQVGRCLSFTDLYALVGPESTGFARWADANSLAQELGGTEAAPYPDAPLDIFGPGEESGTFDSFIEIALEGIAEERGQEPITRPDYNASANDNVIIEGIAGSTTSLGWVGYAFYTENSDQVRAFEIAGGDGGCVAPTDETIADGDYPISRPLFIYVNANRAQDKPALVDFVDFYVEQVGPEADANAAGQAGYVALTAEEHTSTLDAWEGR